MAGRQRYPYVSGVVVDDGQRVLPNSTVRGAIHYVVQWDARTTVWLARIDGDFSRYVSVWMLLDGGSVSMSHEMTDAFDAGNHASGVYRKKLIKLVEKYIAENMKLPLDGTAPHVHLWDL